MSEQELKSAISQVLQQRGMKKELLTALQGLMSSLQTPGDRAAKAATITEAPVPSGQIPEGRPKEFGEQRAKPPISHGEPITEGLIDAGNVSQERPKRAVLFSRFKR